jgi:hypothetical protein
MNNLDLQKIEHLLTDIRSLLQAVLNELNKLNNIPQ